MAKCSIPDCGKDVLARGWCERHYRRWYRNGSPTTSKPRKRKPGRLQRPTPPGYIGVSRRGHIIADVAGTTTLHRLVLFEKIGYGPHWCTHCGCHLNWHDGLCADHLDTDKTNNDPANLVESCLACNTKLRFPH